MFVSWKSRARAIQFVLTECKNPDQKIVKQSPSVQQSVQTVTRQGSASDCCALSMYNLQRQSNLTMIIWTLGMAPSRPTRQRRR